MAVEVGPRRVLPALPATDVELGEIRWERWTRAPRITHFDQSCGSCAYPGPLAYARGQVWYTPEPSMVRVARSRMENGRRVPSRWVRTQHRSYWAYALQAVRCQACDEMTVWVTNGFVPRCEQCGGLSPKELDGKRAQCPSCPRLARHVTPSGSHRITTWVEIAYHPPVAQAVRPRGEVQEDTLF
ncbi:MAG TPA: hypothetical protein VIM84_11095 [Gemmatimonadales bacterium]